MRYLLFILSVIMLFSFSCGDDWRPEFAVIVDCDWLSQQPEDGLNPNKNCGPTVLVMAVACIEKYQPEYDEVNALIDWMGDNVDSYDDIGENDTSISQLEEAAKGYYGIFADSFYETSSLLDLTSLLDLYGDLQRGFPVLVAVPSQKGNATDVMKEGNGHFMLLIGMTPTHVILHDPGPWDASLGRAHEYTIDSFDALWNRAGIRFLH